MTAPFAFFDLRTPAIGPSRDFYTALAGWTVIDTPAGPGTTIPLFTDGGEVWGGFTELPPGDDRAPQWVPYIPVTDLDEATARAESLGAKVTRARVDLPPGSAVTLADPGGAPFVLWQAAGAH
jgi:uncharacterized protein